MSSGFDSYKFGSYDSKCDNFFRESDYNKTAFSNNDFKLDFDNIQYTNPDDLMTIEEYEAQNGTSSVFGSNFSFGNPQNTDYGVSFSEEDAEIWSMFASNEQ